jgi:pimeloyl-ACP methyl ester carboxylesterase
VDDIRVESGDAQLAASYSAAGDVVVVALHGASEGTRDCFLLEHLHRLLPPIGVGVVTFDRRGEGASSGEPSRGRFDVQVLDALAIAGSIDARTIGLWGYSQGAWIAPLAATASEAISFVIGIAATGVTPSRQMNFAVFQQLRRAGYDAGTISRALELRMAFESEIHGGAVERRELAGSLLAASAEPWWPLTFLRDVPLEPEQRAQWIEEMDFDPRPSFRGVSVPLLLFYGENDEWSPVRENVATWRDAQGDNAEIVVIPGVGHDLRGPNGVMSEVYESQLVSWLQRSFV